MGIPTLALILALAVVAWVFVMWMWGSILVPGALTPAGKPGKAWLPGNLEAQRPATADVQRQPLGEKPQPQEQEQAEILDFRGYLELLVKIGVGVMAAEERDDLEAARKRDAEGKEVLAELLRQVEVPEEEALHTLTGLLSEDDTMAGRLRRAICIRLVQLGLTRRHAAHEHGSSRDPLNHLVHSLLACIPQDEVLAEDLGRLLVDEPYLELEHENAVLDLVTLASEDRFLIPIATSLLQTLWKNLEQTGARTAQDLASLALLFKGDTNPSRRLAALKHLLTAENGRFRELVLQEAVAGRDKTLAAELAMVIATELPPKLAMRDLQRLSTVSTEHMMAAFLTLGNRSPKILRQTYEQKLADSTHPDFRAELVTGAGFQDGATGLGLAELAFAEDPNTRVRTRALFVISARGGAGQAERVLMAALDDESLSGTPAQLGNLVLALENLAAKGDPNAIARVARRLKGRGNLSDQDRLRLKRVLSQSLPSQNQK